MVIATNGDSRINYNRIISSSSSPYTVDSSSKTYRSPTSNGRLKALFIIDLDNARSLIYDSTALSCLLAKINFAGPSPSISF